jgi:quinol monooxygenase YgiN
VFIYQIKIDIKPFKSDEFVNSMRSFSSKIRKQKGCLGYSVNRDAAEGNTYRLLGEWKTRQALDEHFRTYEFEILIGAAKVLGEIFEMNIAEVAQSGGFDLARERMALRKETNGNAD